jgi:hypothetical protein
MWPTTKFEIQFTTQKTRLQGGSSELNATHVNVGCEPPG